MINEIPKTNDAMEFIINNFLLLFSFIEQNLFIITYLKFAPINDPNEIIEK